MQREEGFYWVVVKHFWDEESDEPEVAKYIQGEWLRIGYDIEQPDNEDVTVISSKLEP